MVVPASSALAAKQSAALSSGAGVQPDSNSFEDALLTHVDCRPCTSGTGAPNPTSRQCRQSLTCASVIGVRAERPCHGARARAKPHRAVSDQVEHDGHDGDLLGSACLSCRRPRLKRRASVSGRVRRSEGPPGRVAQIKIGVEAGSATHESRRRENQEEPPSNIEFQSFE